MMENIKKNRELIASGISLVVAVVFFVCCLSVPALETVISSYGNINILVYGLTLVLFCGCFFVCMLVFTKLGIGKCSFLETKKSKQIIFYALLAFMAVGGAAILAYEADQYGGVAYKYGWHTQPLWLVMLLLALEIVVFLWMNAKCKINSKELEWFVWAVFIALTVLIWYSMDTPNIFGRGNEGDWYHGHAYFNSIFNVYWGMPYTNEITSIYGHYALFWKIPMELVKGDFRMFIFILAGLTALIHTAAFLVLKKVVNSRMLQIIGAFAITLPILGMRGGYYWQVWPHRIVFPVILLLYAAIVLKNNKMNWLTIAGGYGLSILAVIWNTETGMILAAAWAVLCVSMILSENKFSWKKLIVGVIIHVAGIVISFLGAFGIVNLYNILKHSPANTIQEFLIPLLSDSYMTDILHLDMPLVPNGYMPEIILFLMGVVVGVRDWKWFRKNDNEIPWKTHFMLFLSISALGRFVYYMNRPAFHNMDCCHISVIVLSVMFAEKGLQFVRKQEWKKMEYVPLHRVVKNSISIVCMITVLAMGTGTILQFSQNSEIKENFHNIDEIDGYFQAIEEEVPENTFAFGANIAELYSWLHWEPGYWGIDFTDMSVAPHGSLRVIKAMQEQNIQDVLTTLSSLQVLERHNPEGYQWFCENYELSKSFPVYTTEYVYYVKK